MDWTPYLPVFDSQDSFITHTDFMDCVSMSAVHIIETLIKFHTGKDKHYSPRALAKLAGTTKDGVSLQAVINAINTYGLIPYDLWPDPRDFTWDQYYAAIPAEILAQAEKFEVSFVPASEADLATTPLWIIVAAGNTTHIIEQINETQIFDSETDSQAGAIRPINTYGAILQRHKIIIKDIMIPTFVKQTANIDGEIGVFIKTSDPSGLPALNTFFGVNIITHADGSIPTEITAKKV